MARRDENLYRDTEDKMLGGVCAGLARYFDVDTTLMRVIFVALALVGGGAAIAYVVLWVVLEPAPAGYWGDELPPPAAPPVTLAEETPIIDLAAPEADTAVPAPTGDEEETLSQDPLQP